LQSSHVPEWKRAGLRGIAHLVRVHLADSLEDQVAKLSAPVLLLRAERDRLSTEDWVTELADVAPDARTVRMPGAHAFVWNHPHAWSAPLRALAERVGTAT
jgi:pimeloyl-ACP methyl ester carboxylesterase